MNASTFAKAMAMVPRRFIHQAASLPLVDGDVFQPDFYDASSDTAIEVMSQHSFPGRRVLAQVRRLYPDLRLIVVLEDPHRPTSRGAIGTMRQWAGRHGIEVRCLSELSRL